MPIKIERIRPRPGRQEEPIRTDRGYELARPGLGERRNQIGSATFVKTLEEAADLIAKGYSIRMGRTGLRPSLISAKSVRVTR